MIPVRRILPILALAPLVHAVTTKEFTDVTGTIKIRVKTCDYVRSTRPSGNPFHIATATCGVDGGSGYVLVGGGAEIEGSANPGALLKGSRPDPNSGVSPIFKPTRWIAHSSQYAVSSQTHRLRAYSIGLRLVGLSASELQSNLDYGDQTSDFEENPTKVAFPGNPGQVLIGGGAIIQPIDAELFLKESIPEGDGWRASFHNNGNAEMASAKAHTIAINPCPQRGNGTTWGCLGFSVLGASGQSSSGYAFSAEFEPPDANGRTFWMVTSVGGATYPDVSAFRMLTDIVPTYFQGSNQIQGMRTWSKNTAVLGSGYNVAWLKEIYRQ